MLALLALGHNLEHSEGDYAGAGEPYVEALALAERIDDAARPDRAARSARTARLLPMRLGAGPARNRRERRARRTRGARRQAVPLEHPARPVVVARGRLGGLRVPAPSGPGPRRPCRLVGGHLQRADRARAHAVRPRGATRRLRGRSGRRSRCASAPAWCPSRCRHTRRSPSQECSPGEPRWPGRQLRRRRPPLSVSAIRRRWRPRRRRRASSVSCRKRWRSSGRPAHVGKGSGVHSTWPAADCCWGADSWSAASPRRRRPWTRLRPSTSSRRGAHGGPGAGARRHLSAGVCVGPPAVPLGRRGAAVRRAQALGMPDVCRARVTSSGHVTSGCSSTKALKFHLAIAPSLTSVLARTVAVLGASGRTRAISPK